MNKLDKWEEKSVWHWHGSGLQLFEQIHISVSGFQGLVGWYSRKSPIELVVHLWVQGSWNAKVQDVPRWCYIDIVECLNWNSGLNGHKRQIHFYLQMGLQRRDKSAVMMMIIIVERWNPSLLSNGMKVISPPQLELILKAKIYGTCFT
jgi:hypothetical protein